MKKRLIYALVAMVVGSLALLSCNDNNGGGAVKGKKGPSAVAGKMLDKMIAQDYVGAVRFLNEAEEADEEDVAEVAKLLQKVYEAKGGMKSYKILEQTIDEEGDEAVVKALLKTGDGEEEETELHLVKTDKGWFVELL